MKGFERSVELKNVTASKAAVDPKPSFRLTLPPQHRLALADEASELHPMKSWKQPPDLFQ